jgi:hypothetical protein
MKPFKITLILRNTSAPHLYLDQLKELIKDDKAISDSLKGALKVMKKAKMPFIRLANKKELVIVSDQYLHFERALDPSITGWARLEWSDEEKKEFDNNPKQHIKNVLEMFKKIGYDTFDHKLVDEDELEELFKFTEKGKKKGG